MLKGTAEKHEFQVYPVVSMNDFESILNRPKTFRYDLCAAGSSYPMTQRNAKWEKNVWS